MEGSLDGARDVHRAPFGPSDQLHCARAGDVSVGQFGIPRAQFDREERSVARMDPCRHIWWKWKIPDFRRQLRNLCFAGAVAFYIRSSGLSSVAEQYLIHSNAR